MLNRRRFSAERAASEPRNNQAQTRRRRAVYHVIVNTIKTPHFAVFAFFGGDTNSLMPRNFLHTSLLER